MPKQRVQVPGLNLPSITPGTAPGSAPGLRVPNASPIDETEGLTKKLAGLFGELADDRQDRLKSEAREFVQANKGTLIDGVLDEIEAQDLTPEQLRNARIGAMNKLVELGVIDEIDNPFFNLEHNGALARAAALRAGENALKRMEANGGEELLGALDENGIRSGGLSADAIYAQEVGKMSEVALLKKSALARREYAQIIEKQAPQIMDRATKMITAERKAVLVKGVTNEVGTLIRSGFVGQDDPEALATMIEDFSTAADRLRAGGIADFRKVLMDSVETAILSVANDNPVSAMAATTFVNEHLGGLMIGGQRLDENPESDVALGRLHDTLLKKEDEVNQREDDRLRREDRDVQRKLSDSVTRSVVAALKDGKSEAEARSDAEVVLEAFLASPESAGRASMYDAMQELADDVISRDPSDRELVAQLESARVDAKSLDDIETARRLIEVGRREGRLKGSLLVRALDNLNAREQEIKDEKFAGMDDPASGGGRGSGSATALSSSLEFSVSSDMEAELFESAAEQRSAFSSLPAAATPEQAAAFNRERAVRDKAIREKYATIFRDADTTLSNLVGTFASPEAVLASPAVRVLSPDVVQNHVERAREQQKQLIFLMEPDRSVGRLFGRAEGLLAEAVDSPPEGLSPASIESTLRGLRTNFDREARVLMRDGGGGDVWAREGELIALAEEQIAAALEGIEPGSLLDAQADTALSQAEVHRRSFIEEEIKDAAKSQRDSGTILSNLSPKYAGIPGQTAPLVSAEWLETVSGIQERAYDKGDVEAARHAVDRELLIASDPQRLAPRSGREFFPDFVADDPSSPEDLGKRYLTARSAFGIPWKTLIAGKATVSRRVRAFGEEEPVKLLGLKDKVFKTVKVDVEFDLKDVDLWTTRVADSHEAATKLFKSEEFQAVVKEKFGYQSPQTLRALEAAQHELVDRHMDLGWIKETSPERVLNPSPVGQFDFTPRPWVPVEFPALESEVAEPEETSEPAKAPDPGSPEAREVQSLFKRSDDLFAQAEKATGPERERLLKEGIAAVTEARTKHPFLDNAEIGTTKAQRDAQRAEADKEFLSLVGTVSTKTKELAALSRKVGLESQRTQPPASLAADKERLAAMESELATMRDRLDELSKTITSGEK